MSLQIIPFHYSLNTCYIIKDKGTVLFDASFIGWVLLILLVVLAIAWFGFLKPEPPPISVEDRAEITLMPLPSHLKMGKGTFVLEDQIGHTFTSLSSAKEAHGGTLLAVVEPVQKLLDSATKN